MTGATGQGALRMGALLWQGSRPGHYQGVQHDRDPYLLEVLL